MSTERSDPSPVIRMDSGEQGQGQQSAPWAGREPPRPVSVLIPCCGQLEYTRLCVRSLLRHSRQPCELIFVDVASLDGTPDFLAGVATAAPLPVEIIRAAAETDIGKACAEALAQARGEFIVWLNNDTIVVSDWLQQMVALCSAHELVGMVGPMSNFAPPSQRAGPVPYRVGSRSRPTASGGARADRSTEDIEAVDAFARTWREQHRGQWNEVETLGGFCLLVKRTVLQRVSFLDEQAEQGIFDANALSMRIRQAGYHLACCRDLFIHHFGSRLAAP
jgi:GT2 family glycosyltransferase